MSRPGNEERERRNPDMIELLGGVAAAIAIVGVYLNNRKMIVCFYLWILSNGLSAVIHWHDARWSLCGRDLIFIVLAFHGIWRWRKKTG